MGALWIQMWINITVFALEIVLENFKKLCHQWPPAWGRQNVPNSFCAGVPPRTPLGGAHDAPPDLLYDAYRLAYSLAFAVFVALSYARAACLPVRPSHAGNASKLMIVGSRDFYRRSPSDSSFMRPTFIHSLRPRGNTLAIWLQTRLGWVKTAKRRRFPTFALQYISPKMWDIRAMLYYWPNPIRPHTVL